MATSRTAPAAAALALCLSACGSVAPPPRAPAAPAFAYASWVPPPPPRDSDHDGIPDGFDACPTLPGVASTVVIASGCPPPGYYDDGLAAKDRDGDGVNDDADACPEDPGPAETRGCAGPPDVDHDGIADAVDACPNVAGPTRPDEKTSGCPTAWIDGERIRIVESVHFGSGSADLAPESSAILDAVGGVLASHADVTRVRIEGHTDGRGSPNGNRALSVKRAESVVRYLVAHGIAAERLEATGVGPDRPIDTNETEAGRATNRRVEFHVVATETSPETRASATFADLEPELVPPAETAPNPVNGMPPPDSAPPMPSRTPSLDTPGL